LPPEQETDMLTRQAEALRGQLDAIEKRLDELAESSEKG
jgi:prefoldin subunit 5